MHSYTLGLRIPLDLDFFSQFEVFFLPSASILWLCVYAGCHSHFSLLVSVQTCMICLQIKFSVPLKAMTGKTQDLSLAFSELYKTCNKFATSHTGQIHLPWTWFQRFIYLRDLCCSFSALLCIEVSLISTGFLGTRHFQDIQQRPVVQIRNAQYWLERKYASEHVVLPEHVVSFSYGEWHWAEFMCSVIYVSHHFQASFI